MCQLAHDAGALAWVDAVHYAAHEPIDVRAIGADMLICSPYKFCGPHLGVAYGGAEVSGMAAVQGAPGAHEPARAQFETGTQPTSCSPDSMPPSTTWTRSAASPRSPPTSASLGQRFLDGLSGAVTVYGRPGMDGRVPTFLVNVDGVAADEVAARLAAEQIGVWAHDSWYSLGLYQGLGYTGKSVRIGFVHYNSPGEVDRLIEALYRRARRAGAVRRVLRRAHLEGQASELLDR